MRSLKELVEIGEQNDLPALDVIKAYLSQPEVLKDTVPLLVGMLQDQIRDLTAFKSRQMNWQGMPLDYYYQQYPVEVAAHLDSMTRHLILGLELNDDEKQWLVENVPHMKKPILMWNALSEEINRLGVQFRDGDPSYWI